MISGFNLTQDEWRQIPQPVRSAAAALHINFTFSPPGWLKFYQQQDSNLSQKVECLERIEGKQKAEIGEMKAKAVELRERLAQNSANSSLPPSSDLPFQLRQNKQTASERKPGAQPGHRGAGRRIITDSRSWQAH